MFSELTGFALSGKMFDRIGMKRTLILSYSLSLCGMFCLLLIPTEDPKVIAGFVLLGKFGISAAFNIAFVGNYYLFPIGIVATSFGICNIFSRIATIMSPFVAELPITVSKIIFIVISGLAFLTSFAI